MQREGPLLLAPDLKETLAQVDQFEIDTRKMVDQHIVCSGLTSPPETVPQLRDGYEQEVITELNLEAAGISTVIWAIGYALHFSLVKLPVVDGDRYAVQKRGSYRIRRFLLPGNAVLTASTARTSSRRTLSRTRPLECLNQDSGRLVRLKVAKPQNYSFLSRNGKR